MFCQNEPIVNELEIKKRRSILAVVPILQSLGVDYLNHSHNIHYVCIICFLINFLISFLHIPDALLFGHVRQGDF